jgi:cob(I)alamin adenosyltransferase
MKIYTKTGDEGKTSLMGGTRVPKHHLRIDTYGTVDELNSVIGMLRELNTDDHTGTVLKQTQDMLFTVGAILAVDPSKSPKNIPDLNEADVTYLEREIDKMNDDLPDLRAFILPGGGIIAIWCHIARSVCRRAERLTSRLAADDYVDPLVLKYLNRLSDYLFVLSRFFTQLTKNTEINWKPRS